MLIYSSFMKFRWKMRWGFNDRSGFTLFEMMMVVTIIGIVSGIAAPRLAEHYRHVSLQDITYQICGDLYNIKSQAIRSQTNCWIDFISDAGTTDPTAPIGQTFQYTLSTTGRTVDLSTYRGNITFTDNPDGSSDGFTYQIRFTSRGTADLSGQVYLTNQDNIIYRVQTSAAGGVSVKKWNSAGKNWY